MEKEGRSTSIILTDDLTPNDIIKELNEDPNTHFYLLPNSQPLSNTEKLKDQNVSKNCLIECLTIRCNDN